MVISDWSSDGGSSDLARANADALEDQREFVHQRDIEIALRVLDDLGGLGDLDRWRAVDAGVDDRTISVGNAVQCFRAIARHYLDDLAQRTFAIRSDEHTSELQSLMRISYAVYCLNKLILRQRGTNAQVTQRMAAGPALVVDAVANG